MSDGPLIEALEVSAHTIPTELPEADGTLRWDRTTVVLVRVRDSAGGGGLGYAYGTPAMVRLIEEVLEPELRGLSLERPREAWLRMVRAVRNLGRPGLCSMAISAVDICLWDALARHRRLPLHRLLGGSRDRLPIYGSGGFTSYDDAQLERQLGGWAEAGIPRVKMKIGVDRGRDPEEDLRRIGLARRCVGDGVELMVDANGAYDRTTALRLGLEAARRWAVVWFEEPVSSDDLEGLRQLRQALPLDLAAGEYGYQLSYFQQMLGAGAVSVLQADVSRCGGITEWLRVADAAAAAQVPLSSHCGQTLHLAAASVAPNLRHLEYFHDHQRIDEMLFEGLPRRLGGELELSPEAGLGLQVKESAAAACRVS